MAEYIALLRGINVGGKNKIPMAALKAGFIELGYAEVSTYLNSGNVIFRSDAEDTAVHASKVKAMVKKEFELDIPVLVISREELRDILNNAPDWWGGSNKEIYDNLIFMFPALSHKEFCDAVGGLKDEYERAYHYNNAVFWSFSRKDYQKTNWWSKTASSNISDKITIRTANTVRKLAGR